MRETEILNRWRLILGKNAKDQLSFGNDGTLENGISCFDLEDALDNASDAMYNWVVAELEDEECNFPHQSDEEDLELPEGAFVRNIMVRVKFLPDSD